MKNNKKKENQFKKIQIKLLKETLKKKKKKIEIKLFLNNLK